MDGQACCRPHQLTPSIPQTHKSPNNPGGPFNPEPLKISAAGGSTQAGNEIEETAGPRCPQTITSPSPFSVTSFSSTFPRRRWSCCVPVPAGSTQTGAVPFLLAFHVPPSHNTHPRLAHRHKVTVLFLLLTSSSPLFPFPIFFIFEPIRGQRRANQNQTVPVDDQPKVVEGAMRNPKFFNFPIPHLALGISFFGCSPQICWTLNLPICAPSPYLPIYKHTNTTTHCELNPILAQSARLI